jgi:hypothetical protein
MQFEKVKTIYRFHRLAFDRGAVALNVSTARHKTMGCGCRPQSKKNEEKTILVFVEFYKEKNQRRSYIFVCCFIHNNKSNIFTPVFNTAPVQVFKQSRRQQ